MEDGFGSSYTDDDLLSVAEDVNLKVVQEEIKKKDRQLLLERYVERSGLHGPGTKAHARTSYKIYAAYGWGNKPCPLCNEDLRAHW